MSTADPAQRDAEILGKPPRIEPLGIEELDDTNRQAIMAIRAAIGAPETDQIPEYFLTMVRHPDLLLRHVEMSTQLFQGALSPRERELAILRIGWLCQAPYEWSAHVDAAKRVAGVTSEEIERVTQGSTAPGWSDHERALLRAVEELYTNAMISDATWATLDETYNEQQLIELPLLVGTYQAVAYLQNSIRFRLPPGAEGLGAR